VCVLTALGEAKVGVQGNDAVIFDMAAGSTSRRPLADVLAEIRGVKKDVAR
jgi:hypothetical protein